MSLKVVSGVSTPLSYGVSVYRGPSDLDVGDGFVFLVDRHLLQVIQHFQPADHVTKYCVLPVQVYLGMYRVAIGAVVDQRKQTSSKLLSQL